MKFEQGRVLIEMEQKDIGSYRPMEGELYFVPRLDVFDRERCVDSIEWSGSDADWNIWSLGLVYREREEAFKRYLVLRQQCFVLR
jgi:hypothetical protein